MRCLYAAGFILAERGLAKQSSHWWLSFWDLPSKEQSLHGSLTAAVKSGGEGGAAASWRGGQDTRAAAGARSRTAPYIGGATGGVGVTGPLARWASSSGSTSSCSQTATTIDQLTSP